MIKNWSTKAWGLCEAVCEVDASNYINISDWSLFNNQKLCLSCICITFVGKSKNELDKNKIRNLKHSIKSLYKLKCSKKAIADVHFYTLNSIAF